MKRRWPRTCAKPPIPGTRHRGTDLRDRHRPRSRGRRGRLLCPLCPAATRWKRTKPAAGSVTLKNHAAGEGWHPVDEIVSPDALAWSVSDCGLPNDPRIVNTVKVIDHFLKVDTPQGPCWHRYSDDGYGEHTDGSPFDGTGVGRAWPLLTGERHHYELAAGRQEVAERLLRAMEDFANESGLLPEQVWDSPDIPERDCLWQAVRIGHAAGLGTCRVRQAASIVARRPRLRHAASIGSALSRGENRIVAYVLAIESEMSSPSGSQNATA